MQVFAILLVVSLLLGCEDNEPAMDFCQLDVKQATFFFHCELSDGKTKDISLLEGAKLGMISTPAAHFTEARKHHKSLHIDLEFCGK